MFSVKPILSGAFTRRGLLKTISLPGLWLYSTLPVYAVNSADFAENLTRENNQTVEYLWVLLATVIFSCTALIIIHCYWSSPIQSPAPKTAAEDSAALTPLKEALPHE